MHPILFQIPLSFWTVAVVALLFGVGSLIRERFQPADRNASYLADFLGLNVRWGEVKSGWGPSLTRGLVGAAVAGALAEAVAQIAQRRFHTDTIPLHIYGLMMASGFIVGIWLAMRAAKKQALPDVPVYDPNGKPAKDQKGRPLTLTSPEVVSDLAFYLLVSGLIGSRILYIITRWDDEYSREPMKMLQVWNGGLVWYGGLIGATLTAAWFVRSRRISFWPYADALVPSVSIGHALGRIGCFSAGCCFGNVAAPWFPLPLKFPQNSPAFYEHLQNGLITASATRSLGVYPTQIMESLGEVLIFFLLLRVASRKRFHGQVLLTYFFLYPILRTIMEMFRGDSIRGFVFHWPSVGHELFMSTSQAASIVVAIAGIVLLNVILRSKAKTEGQQAPSARAA